MSAIGWPDPMGSSPGGGSGCINGMTGLTDWGPQLARGQRRDVMLRLAQRHRGPHGDSAALRQLDVDQADPPAALAHLSLIHI